MLALEVNGLFDSATASTPGRRMAASRKARTRGSRMSLPVPNMISGAGLKPGLSVLAYWVCQATARVVPVRPIAAANCSAVSERRSHRPLAVSLLPRPARAALARTPSADQVG
jgi:hypothetical protein